MRFGARHTFSPNSIFLGSFTYQNARFAVKEEELGGVFPSLNARRPENAVIGELQHLFRSQYFNLTAGAGYAKIDGHIDAAVGTIFPPPLDIIPLPRTPTNLKHTNVYAYSYINVLKNVTFTLGASGDIATGDNPDFNDTRQFNPKFGITWNPLPDTTIRSAIFRVLKRTLVTNQTLEPTQVAGFNQFFDDFNGTKAWRYGGAIDQKFTNEIFGGLEFSKRDMKVPFLDVEDPNNPTARDEKQHETLSRAYLFWTPHPWFALRAEFMYERFRSQGSTDQPTELNTYRVPLGIGFFHPSGWSALLKATYFNQDGHFVLNNGTRRSGNDDFVTVDAGISYRLPNRYGFLTLGAINLFDKKFKFFDRDTSGAVIRNPSVQPDRTVLFKVTLALP